MNQPSLIVPVQFDQATESPRKMILLRARYRKQKDNLRWEDAESTARDAVCHDQTSPIAYQMLFEAVLNSEKPERFPKIIRAAIQYAHSVPRFPAVRHALLSLQEKERLVLLESMTQKWPILRSTPAISSLLNHGTSGDISTDYGDESIAQEALHIAIEENKEQALSLLQDALAKATTVKQQEIIQIYTENVSAMPDPKTLCRPLIENTDQEISISTNTNTGKVALVFSGLGRNTRLPLKLIDAFFASIGYTTIFIRDKSHTLSMSGIRSLGTDRQTTQAKLHSLIDSLNCEELTVFGKSGGGFPAIHYGVEMGADRIIAFSPPTCMTTRFKSSINDSRAPAYVRRLEKEIPLKNLDTARIIEQYKPTCPIEIYYGADRKTDRDHANHLRGYKNVFLSPIPNYTGHDSIRHFMINGTLQTLLS